MASFMRYPEDCMHMYERFNEKSQDKNDHKTTYTRRFGLG